MSSVTGLETTLNGFVDEIRQNFNYVLAGIACSSRLFTLLVWLLGFSSKESRRRVVFQLNVLVIVICVALTLGILVGLTSEKAIIDGYNQVSKSVYIAAITFALYPPLLSDSILLIRLLRSTLSLARLQSPQSAADGAFYRPSSWTNLSNLGLTTQALVQNQEAAWYRYPKIIAEWAMEIILCQYLPKQPPCTHVIDKKGDLSEDIRQILYISVANFVFPLMFNIAQIILIMADRSPNAGVLLS
ncbi:hypothetical protein BKA82DRAFT_35363 [Pisolithus tinctorius]|uniref:Uncharacterized protein n=1 Tax=Pisolithus tinctorius Marx 270 TaxID=870435 RepID=A0A0C3NEA8_PISTI|nr:hypothetical protein BKA82DRAFT_35363 [Pisolithus tinctorius]KIN94110.1 hypothetical protein M404DRAFT_35363 [Pisolithus tinctorius Marx 270]